MDIFLSQIDLCDSLDSLRGLEGEASSAYFEIFNDLILDPDSFSFHGRSRRPPLDEVNALLSFAYTLLTNECVSALSSVGMEACFGFIHQDHPGRFSLACDLVEELRSSIANRFVLFLMNNRIVHENCFDKRSDGAVYLNRDGRRIFLSHWQNYKSGEILHPVLQEKMEIGLIPFAQSALLAKKIRGEIDAYIPFFRR